MTNKPKSKQSQPVDSDALITYYAIVSIWVKNNVTLVIGATVGVIALISIGIFMYTTSLANERAAEELLGFAEIKFSAGEYEAALFGDDQTFTAGFADIIATYPRTKAANMAKYYAAVSEFNLDNYESALLYIRDFNPPTGIMGVGPITLYGSILMSLERYSDAVPVFKKAAEWDENSSTTPFNLLMAAESALLAGNHGQAENFVSQIVTRYENSPAATRAHKLRGKLATMGS
jgi:tetratricopeptide (TPR) repeat protein